jgi:hypothetical protein
VVRCDAVKLIVQLGIVDAGWMKKEMEEKGFYPAAQNQDTSEKGNIA